MSVTVVIPAYNRPEGLRAALQSAGTQTVLPAEIVVTDQGVNPALPDIVEQARDAYPVEINYVRQTRPVSPANNWYTGLRAVNTPWVKVLADDDLMAPTCLQKQLALSEGKRLVQSAAYANGQIWYGQTIPGASELARMVASGAASPNPVTSLIDTDTVFKGLSMVRRLSWNTYKSGCGPNLLLIYGGILDDWQAYANTPEPLCTLGGFNETGDNESYTLRLMRENRSVWQESYNETYTLLNELAGSA